MNPVDLLFEQLRSDLEAQATGLELNVWLGSEDWELQKDVGRTFLEFLASRIEMDRKAKGL